MHLRQIRTAATPESLEAHYTYKRKSLCYYNIRSSCLSASKQARTTIFQGMCENPAIFVVVPQGNTGNFGLYEINDT